MSHFYFSSLPSYTQPLHTKHPIPVHIGCKYLCSSSLEHEPHGPQPFLRNSFIDFPEGAIPKEE
uniref:NADH dehydrogenase ubiquinone 1 alpha subcomplex subunit 2 n=1 Tax=Rhizophora mucronata TaxID=61149 RepID=A0A2P2K0R3_RHIMU